MINKIVFPNLIHAKTVTKNKTKKTVKNCKKCAKIPIYNRYYSHNVLITTVNVD